MLPGILGIGGFIGGASVEQTDSRTTAATSHSTVNFGPDVPGRWILILAWHGNTASSPGQNPSATIGGISATRINAHSTGDGAGTAVGVAMFVAQPSGLNGTVAVSWGGLTTTIVAIRVTGYDLSAAVSSDAKGTAGNSVLIDIPDQGLLIGAVGRADEVTSITWTNLTEKADESAAGTRRSWGWDFPLPAQTGRSVSYSPFSSALGANAVVAASFAPS